MNSSRTDRVTYLYRANSVYNRRFEQRRRLKELLGPWRPLVETAKRRTKTLIIDGLTKEERDVIRRILSVPLGRFWRACHGREFLSLPPRPHRAGIRFRGVVRRKRVLVPDTNVGIPIQESPVSDGYGADLNVRHSGSSGHA